MVKRIFLLLFLVIFVPAGFAQGIAERFSKNMALSYKVYFNGIPNGTIKWHYLGVEKFGDRKVDIIFMESDAKIVQFLNIESKEKVFLDSSTHLPFKVERNLLVFGKKELITEIYDQTSGSVSITKQNSKTETQMINQVPPIHNILALIYFFPKDIELEAQKEMIFNLPTQKVKIKMISQRVLAINNEKRDCYFLLGRGAKKFNLWLDKKERLPLRVEFIVAVGKISVVRTFD